MKFSKLFIFISLALAFIHCSCANQSAVYKNALGKDNLESFHRYLKMYPNGIHAKVIKERIEFKEFIKAERTKKYKQFLEKYPNGKYSKKVKKRLWRNEIQVFTCDFKRPFEHYTISYNLKYHPRYKSSLSDSLKTAICSKRKYKLKTQFCGYSKIQTWDKFNFKLYFDFINYKNRISTFNSSDLYIAKNNLKNHQMKSVFINKRLTLMFPLMEEKRNRPFLIFESWY